MSTGYYLVVHVMAKCYIGDMMIGQPTSMAPFKVDALMPPSTLSGWDKN